MQTKICSKCGEDKPISEFHKDKSKRFGIVNRCKECKRSLQAKQKDVRLSLIPEGFKLCSKCGEEKEVSEFHIDNVQRSGLACSCNKCKKPLHIEYYSNHKEEILEYNKNYRKNEYRKNPDKEKSRQLKMSFGITIDDYYEMLEIQKGVCAICGEKEKSKTDRGKLKALSVDHNHKTGKVRGLLCYKCNHLLGNAQDDIEVLNSAIKYLKNKR